MMELWLPIQNYPGYWVSTQGRVLSFRRKQPSFLKPQKHHRKGYYSMVVRLADKRFQIHRLVCQAFLENPRDCRLVRHLDGDVHNNRLENLSWGTDQQNVDDMRKHGTARFFGRPTTINHLEEYA